jgi:uncharacterized protein (TIGR02145 family)
MKNKSKYWTFLTALITVLLMLNNSCTKENQKEIQLPTVTTDLVTDISSTSAICKGNVLSDGGYQTVNRGIYWSNIITLPGHNDDYKWEGWGTGSFSCLMDYLIPGTTYYVRAYAINTAGTNYGKVIQFSTTGSLVGDIVFNQNLMYGLLTDIVGNAYKTIKIGTQTWMAENLKTTKYNDGTDIPNITSRTEWINLSTPGYCWYLNDSNKYKNIYGALYNWYVLNTGKVCPAGWHVPSNLEWTTLTTYLGGDRVADSKLKETGTTHWINTYTEVINSSGFTALPGGNCWGVITEPLTYFGDLGYAGHFWSTSEYHDSINGFYGAYSRTFIGGFEEYTNQTFTKTQGLSIRCIQDSI